MSVTNWFDNLEGVDSGDTTLEVKIPEIRGWIDLVRFEPGSPPYDGGATFKLEVVRASRSTLDDPTEIPAEAVLSGIDATVSHTLRPRAPVHDATGTVVVGVVAEIGLAAEKIRITVTDGGDGKFGRFHVNFRRPY